MFDELRGELFLVPALDLESPCNCSLESRANSPVNWVHIWKQNLVSDLPTCVIVTAPFEPNEGARSREYGAIGQILFRFVCGF